MTGADEESQAAAEIVPPPTRPRLMLGFGAAAVLVLAAVVVAVCMLVFAPRGETRPVAASPPATDRSGVADTVPALFVHVSGAVEEPGLYQLAEGSRVVDAVGAAGGFSSDAVRSSVNLARVLKDGEHLAVPGEDDPPPESEGSGGSGPININTAAADELEQLPRVGPATAQRIIAWRESNGPFTTVDDLLQVSGIGEKTLDGFRDHITT